MSVTANNKVVAVTEGDLDYSLFTHQPSLPIADEAAMFNQCGSDWSFVLELLKDIVLETRTKPLLDLKEAVTRNDHRAFHHAAHFIKSAALNLWLPALVDVAIRAEALGKQLEVPFSSTDRRLLDSRPKLIEAIEEEIARLEEYIPELEGRVEAEGAGGGEGEEDLNEDFNEEENRNGG